jgi:hypothetical protein
MRAFVIAVGITATIAASCSSKETPSASLADAQASLCADFSSHATASASSEREDLNQLVMKDAALFEQAGDQATADGLRAFVAALRTIERLRQEKTEMVVLLNVDASQAQIDAIEKSLSGAPGVASVRFVSKEEAYALFKEALRDHPALIKNVSASALPASLHLHLSSSAAFDQVAALAMTLPGVDHAAVDLTEAGAEADAFRLLPALQKCLTQFFTPPSLPGSP